MKSLLTIILILLFSTLFAQEKGDVNFLPEGGINFSFPAGGDIFMEKQAYREEREDNPDEDLYRPFRPRVGITAGFRIEYFVLKKLGFGSGLIYNQKGWTEVYGTKFEDGYDRTKEKYRLDYIDIPFVVVVNLNGYHFYGGPVLSILVFQRVIAKNKTKNGDDVEKEKEKYGFYNSGWGEEGNPRTITGGFQFGFKKQMQNGLTYGAGFAYTTILPAIFPVNLNTFQLQLTVGKVFQLKDKTTPTSQVSTKQNDAYVKTEAITVETKVASNQPAKQETKAEQVNKISEEKPTVNASASNSNISSTTTAQKISEQPKQEPVIDTKPVIKQNYFIDYGMANLEASAQKITDNLKSKGYDAHYYWIPDREKEYIPMYRIYIGPFDSEPLANSILPKLKKMQSTATVSTGVIH